MSLATLHKAAAAATPLHNSFVPRLVVTKQTCVSSESSMRDGVSRQVYVVVKHSPFSICLALEQPIEALNNTSNRKTIGFNSGQLTARLLYDSEDEKVRDERAHICVCPPVCVRSRGLTLPIDVSRRWTLCA